jgi:hypothetical protein
MNHREELVQVLSSILQTALLRIRAAGWSGDAQRCALEADHVHNIPAIIASGSDALLQSYWEVDRPAFVAQAGQLSGFEPLWSKLESLMEPHATAP